MKKMLPLIVGLLGCLACFSSCNKGDDNPYKNWRCTCFINRAAYIGEDKYFIKDTAVLKADNMDKESATAFCNSAKAGYSDTSGSNATCNLK